MKRIFACVCFCCSFVLLVPQVGLAQDVQLLSEQSAANTRVDINSANAETLALALDGIGMAKAEDIVAFREANGRFKNVEELALVKGVGPATIARNRDKIIVSSTPQDR
jgi:competence protein ComEA